MLNLVSSPTSFNRSSSINRNIRASSSSSTANHKRDENDDENVNPLSVLRNRRLDDDPKQQQQMNPFSLDPIHDEHSPSYANRRRRFDDEDASHHHHHKQQQQQQDRKSQPPNVNPLNNNNNNDDGKENTDESVPAAGEASSPSRQHRHFDPFGVSKNSSNNNSNPLSPHKQQKTNVLDDFYSATRSRNDIHHEEQQHDHDDEDKDIEKQKDDADKDDDEHSLQLHIPPQISVEEQQRLEREQQKRFTLELQKRLRIFFLHHSPGMIPSIETIVKRYAHREHELWMKLFAKYGGFPSSEDQNKSKKSAVRNELVRYLRKYDPSIESKVDDILNAFADFHDIMWKSLEVKYGGARSSVVNKRGRNNLNRSSKKNNRNVDGSSRSISAGTTTTRLSQKTIGGGDGAFVDSLGQTLRSEFDITGADDEDDEDEIDDHEDDDDESDLDKEEDDEEQQETLSKTTTSLDPNNNASSKNNKKKKRVSIPMDLTSRLRRFFDKVDPSKVPRADEIAMNYKYNEVELRDALTLLYCDHTDESEERGGENKITQQQPQLEAPIGGWKETDNEHRDKKIDPEKLKSARKIGISTGRLPKQDAGKWVLSFCRSFAPEKLDEVELILTRFEGRETEMREALEAVFGQVKILQSYQQQQQQQQQQTASSPPQARRSEVLKQKRKEIEELKRKRFEERSNLSQQQQDLIGDDDGGMLNDEELLEELIAEDKSIAAAATSRNETFILSRDEAESLLFHQQQLQKQGMSFSQAQFEVSMMMSSHKNNSSSSKSPLKNNNTNSMAMMMNSTSFSPTSKRAQRIALKERLERFFNVYDRRYVPQCASLAAKFLPHQEEFMRRLVKKFGKEPANDEIKELYRERLTKFYQRYQPGNIDRIDELLERHAGREEDLMKVLVRKWGPEPADDIEEEEFRVEDTNMRLHAFFEYYEPAQIKNIDNICNAFKGREHELWSSLYQLYGNYPIPEEKLLKRDPREISPPSGHHHQQSTSPFSPSSSSVSDHHQQHHQHHIPTAYEQHLKRHNNGVLPKETQNRLIKYFSAVDPSKINEISEIYKVFVGREDEMWKTLEKRYGQAETKAETLTSQAAIDTSKRELRVLFEKYFEHYDPSLLYETTDLVKEYLGRESDAREYLKNRFGEEPRYNPMCGDLRKRLILFFRHHDPPQLANVDLIAESYLGMDDDLFNLLTEQYGPEPDVSHPTSKAKFRARLNRYFEVCPQAAVDERRREDLDNIVKKYYDWDDEYMMDLVELYGVPEPPDPDAEKEAADRERKMKIAKNKLRPRVQEFFESYDPDQLANLDTLVESYWEAPEELMKQLYEAYNVETEEVPIDDDDNNKNNKKDSSVEQPYFKIKDVDANYDEDDDDAGINEVGGDELSSSSSSSSSDDEVGDENDIQRKQRIGQFATSIGADPSIVNRIDRMYLKYDRKGAKQLPGMLEMYRGREDELLEALKNKFGADEPSEYEDLTLSPEQIQQRREAKERKKQERERERLEKQRQEEETKKNKEKVLGVDTTLRPKMALPPPDEAALQRRYRDPRGRVLEILRACDPRRVGEADRLLKRYAGQEDDLIEVLEERYDLLPGTLQKHSGKLMIDDEAVRRQQEEEERRQQELEDEDAHNYRNRLLRLLQYYEPSLIPNIDKWLFKYEGREEDLIDMVKAQLTQKYITSKTKKNNNNNQQEADDQEDNSHRGGGGTSEVIQEPVGDVSFRFKIIKFYEAYNPAKRGDVDMVMQKFKGREAQLMKMMILKYKNSEPPDPIPEPLPPQPVLDYRRSVRDRLHRIYKKHAPNKIDDIPDILEKYEGREEDLLDQLDIKYDLAADDLFDDQRKLQEYREQLQEIYQKNNLPEKISQIDSILKKYRGHEENLFEQLAVKYAEPTKKATTTRDNDVDGGNEAEEQVARGIDNNNNNNEVNTTPPSPAESPAAANDNDDEN